MIFEIELPDALTGARIYRENVIGNREVKDPIDHQRCRLDLGIADAALLTDPRDVESPGRFQYGSGSID